MNAAQAFMDALGSENSNDVYEALKAAEHVNESQDWDSGKSTWTFADGSAIMMEGADVYVCDGIYPLFSLTGWKS